MMNARTCAVVGLALALVPALDASHASAQAADDRGLRLGAHLGLGFGGDADFYANDSKSSYALDPTVGFGARAELPIFDFLAIGGLFEALAFEADIPADSDRNWAFDFDAFVRVRYVLEVADGALFLEPYVLLPLGFTFAMVDDPDDFGDGDEAWPGWNTGVLAGLSVLTSSRFGGFIELGWRHHEVYTDATIPFAGDIDFALVTNQFALNLGFVVAL